MSKEVVHSVVLIFAIAFSFLFAKTGLKEFDLQFSAGLFIILFVTKKYLIPQNPRSRLLESVVFTLITLIIVNTTGVVESPFFFLTYFLLFSLSLLLEPVIAITTSLALILFFLLTLPENQSFQSLVPVFSLAFLTPFALFLGQEHLINSKLKRQNSKLQEDTFLFLSLMLKNHLSNIKTAVENFMGDHELDKIKKSTKRMEKLIEEYEKSS
jgi:hypothetical protein